MFVTHQTDIRKKRKLLARLYATTGAFLENAVQPFSLISGQMPSRGGPLVADADNIIIEDAKGGVANLTITNVMQSNGVIDVIDRVLLP